MREHAEEMQRVRLLGLHFQDTSIESLGLADAAIPVNVDRELDRVARADHAFLLGSGRVRGRLSRSIGSVALVDFVLAHFNSPTKRLRESASSAASAIPLAPTLPERLRRSPRRLP